MPRPKPLKTFRVRLPIERASGERIYEIQARTLAEAKRLWEASGGDMECVSEDVEAEQVGEPEFEEARDG